MKSKSDNELLKQIGEGHKLAFAEIYARYKSDVYGLSYRLLKSKSKSEDVCQEAWLKVIQQAAQFRFEGSVKSWIMMIVKNLSLDELKKSKRWMVTEDIELLEVAAVSEEFSNEFWHDLEITKTKVCLDKLPDRQRVALVLFYYEDQTMNALAVQMSLQVNAVKALLFRARKSLVDCVGARVLGGGEHGSKRIFS